MAGTLYPVTAVGGAPSYSGRMIRDAGMSPLTGGGSAARPLGGFSGVRPGTPSSIVTSPSATTWQVTPFGGTIDAEAAAIAGVYGYAFPANETGTIIAQGASARVDRLDVQVSYPAESDGTANPGIAIVYTVGTPGLQAAPARSHPLAQLNVPITGGGSPTVSWVATYTAAPSPLPVLTLVALNLFAGTYVGQYADVFADGTPANNGLYRWTGAAWRPVVQANTWSKFAAGQLANGATITSATFASVPYASVVEVDYIGQGGNAAGTNIAVAFGVSAGSVDVPSLSPFSNIASSGWGPIVQAAQVTIPANTAVTLTMTAVGGGFIHNGALRTRRIAT